MSRYMHMYSHLYIFIDMCSDNFCTALHQNPTTRYRSPSMPTPSLSLHTQKQGDLQFDCSGLEDGLYPDLRRGCKRYYSCKRGLKDTHSCSGQEEVFNQDMYACVPASTYSCPANEKRELDEVGLSRL